MRVPLVREDDVLGTVLLCRRCGEEWPLDREFWYFAKDGHAQAYCRACWAERNAELHARRRSLVAA